MIVLIFIFDFCTLVLTGLLNVVAIDVARKQGTVTLKETLWIIILQFIFCADVVASIVLYSKLNKRQSELLDNILQEA